MFTIDTHCHLNMMVQKDFDTPLVPQHQASLQGIVQQAALQDVRYIINVGTSLIESQNCIMLANMFTTVFAAVGIHPNDCTPSWQEELRLLAQEIKKNRHRIVAIGECGLDFHYPDYNVNRQRDAFRAQIELALENELALIVHTRDAYEETVRILEEFKNDVKRGIIHCFYGDQQFARAVMGLHYSLGIGGTVTYPKNNVLRDIVATTPLQNIVLETDAPFLPPQTQRGKQNTPANIKEIAQYIAELQKTEYAVVAQKTSGNAMRIFKLHEHMAQ